MDDVEGAKTFRVAGATYDSFMGRYSAGLASPFADQAGVEPGARALDVGCGPGALTGELVTRLGAESVAACDPSPDFVAECARRFPAVDVRQGRAESLPFEPASFDVALAQLVLHFVSDAELASREMARVVRPGGAIAACVWDFDEGMEMLRAFWDAATALDPNAPDEARTLRFGRPGEIAEVFTSVGLVDVRESEITTSSAYDGFEELWSGFLAGVGPAGSFCVALDPDGRARLHDELFERVGRPDGSFTLNAVARCAVASVPS
jgi:SAM-dependent methyltransferase